MRIGGRRLLAVMAGGVVLVGGGVTTLAAWQDQTYDRAPLTLSRFNVQQTLDGTGAEGSWVEADTDGAPSDLLLTVGGLSTTRLSPGTVSTGWVGLRVDAGSVGGAVTLQGATIGTDASGLAPQLQYQAVAGVPEVACRAGSLPASGVTVLATDGSLLTAATGTGFRLEPGTGGTAGAMVGVCIRLSLRPTVTRALSGSTVAPVWRFSATSDS